MNILTPCTENTAQEAEHGTFSSDWVLPEISPVGENVPFDGKIIARMPDLGNHYESNTLERSKSAPFWTQTVIPVFSMIQAKATALLNAPPDARQQFFFRLTSFGCVVLLCGIVLLFLERGERKRAKPDLNTAESVLESPEPLVNNAPVIFSDASPVVPVFQPELPNALPPVASEYSSHTDSIWDRPPAHAFSLWEPVPVQPEDPFSTPAAPSVAVPMQPMVDMSANAVPFDHQFLAQSPPPVHTPAGQPADPFVQTPGQPGHVVSGMTPMQGRQEQSAPGIATSQGARQHAASPPLHPQYMPTTAVQGVHPPYRQQHPQASPPSVPIPSGVSTLPVQTGQYPPQPAHGIASPQHPAANFYNTPPSMYRGLY